jgi:3-oxoadipate enol-lactonase
MRLEHALDGPADAPALVLGNSLGTDSSLWDEHLPAFTARFRVLRFELPGHGGSPAPDEPFTVQDVARAVAGLLDAEGIQRASVCGLSLGGAVAMALAGEAPHRVERAVLACTTPRFGTEQLWRDRGELVRREGVGAVVDAALERWFTVEFRAAHPEVIDAYRERYLRTSAAGYARCCDALAVWDYRDRLAGIRAPALVVCGEGDPVVPPQDAAATAAAIPGARFELVTGAAHLVSVERPGEFRAIALAHLEGGSDE